MKPIKYGKQKPYKKKKNWKMSGETESITANCNTCKKKVTVEAKIGDGDYGDDMYDYGRNFSTSFYLWNCPECGKEVISRTYYGYAFPL